MIGFKSQYAKTMNFKEDGMDKELLNDKSLQKVETKHGNVILSKKMRMEFLADWKQRSILVLLEDECFQKDVRKISACLEITTDEVFQAIESLKEKGFVTETKQGFFQQNLKAIKISVKDFTPEEKVKAHAMLCADFFPRIKVTSNIKFNSSFVFCNRNTLKRFQKQLDKVCDSFLKEIEKDQNCDTLVGFQYIFLV